MAVCGLPAKYGNHAQKMVDAALEIRDFIEKYKEKRQEEGKSFFEMRIGINSGEVLLESWELRNLPTTFGVMP
jgi:class 3 adenylate cyclase